VLSEGRKLDKKQSWNVGYWLLAAVLLLRLQSIWQSASQSEVVPYSAFEQALSEGRILAVTVTDLTMTGRLKATEGQKSVLVTARIEPDLAARLDKYNVPYTRVVERTWLKNLASWLLPTLVFFGLWFYLFRSFADKQGMGGVLSIGKSRAKIYVQANTGVTFANVAGDFGQRICRDVCRCGRGPRARPVRSSAPNGASHHLH